MGVWGLQTYMLQCPQAAYKVNIKQLIEEYKQAKGVEEVTIVTSGNALMDMLYRDLNWLCGGQYKEFKARVENFVSAFESLGGVRLVVFFEGATTQQKLPIWIERRYKRVKSALEIYAKLRRGDDFTTDDDSGTFLMPTSLGMVEHFVFKLICDCDVRIAVGECDEEIAEFARSENCFAFLGLDTDFVIQNCFYNFFSLHELDLSSMTALKYDSWGLARALQIPAVKLPLLATLCGNDYINVHNDLKSFHRNILREYPTPRKPYRIAVTHSVAAYVRTLPNGEAMFGALPKIASKVFGDTNRAKDLERSIRSYLPVIRPKAALEPSSPCSHWEEITIKAHDSFCGGETRSIYSILIDQPFEMSNALEDYQEDSVLPLTATLYLPLRKRIYGILLKEKPGGPGLVEELCCSGLNSLDNPTYVEPVVPREELHPGLLSLWGDGTVEGKLDTGDIVDMRWNLFAHSVSTNLSTEGLRSLAEGGMPHLVIPTSILKYLRDAIPRDATASSPQYFQDWELEAFAIQAVLLTTTDPSKLTVQTPYDVRAIQLATIFMRAVSQMLLLLASCGFPIAMAQAMPWLYFDGKLFHQTYVGLKNKKHVESMCINQDGKSLVQEFMKVRNIVLGPA